MKKWKLILCLAAITVIVVVCSVYFQTGISEEKTKKYEEITMVLPTYGYIPDDMDLVTGKMNEITMDKCGVKVNYIYTNVVEMYLNCAVRLKAGEKIDLMPGMNENELNSYIADGMITPLDSYVEKDGEVLKGAYPEKLWNMTEKNQEHYSVCALDHGAVKEGLLIRREVLKAIDVEEEEILHAWNLKEKHDYEALDEIFTPIFEKIKNSDAVLEDGTKVKDMYLGIGYDGIFSQFQLLEFDGFGNLFGGTLGDDEGLVNLFGSKEYKSMLKVIRKWVENGYVHPVDAQINESTVLWYETGSCFGMFTDTSAENQARISEKAGVETTGITLLEGKLNTSQLQVGNWVIPAASEHKEGATKILELMYTDPEFVALYIYGIEGVHYKVLENGEKEIISDRYRQDLTWIFGNIKLADDGKDAIEEVKELYENASYSAFNGFQYDDRNYHTEIENMNNCLQKTVSKLEAGEIPNVDAALGNLNRELYEQGLPEVMVDKQKQLEEWISEQ